MSESDNYFAANTATTIQPMESASGPGVLAPRGTRFVSALIDGLIVLPLVIPIAFAVGFVIGMVFGDGIIMSILSSVVGGLIGFGSFFVIHGYFLAQSGQTIGKKLFKIKIVKDDGTKPELAQLILMRYGSTALISMIPFVGRFYGLVDALFIFDGSHKCLHDRIAGTRVVME